MEAHAVYLAVIAVLVIIIAHAAARAARAQVCAQAYAACAGVRAAPPRAAPLRRLSGAELLRGRTLGEYRAEVDALVARAQALGEFGTGRLASACGQALSGGKRLRPIILLEVARAAAARGGASEPVDVAEAALFIEYLHTASLVVDDLPEFDNDIVRRGAPSLHAAAGPAVAQMAALALVAAAFQNMCRQIDVLRDAGHPAPDLAGTLACSEVCRALGAAGAAGGQCKDIAPPDVLYEEGGGRAVADLVYQKTATFFEIAFVVGWLAAGGGAGRVGAMREAGRQLGTAFQIADDLADQEADAARAAAGRPGWNYATEYGRAAAREAALGGLEKAQRLLAQERLWTPLWEEIFRAIRDVAGPGVL